MHEDARQKIIVIGGGISGLAAAHRLCELSRDQGKQLDIILLEASDRLGGVFGTEQVGSYTIETGADSFITNKPWGANLVDRLGKRDEMIAPDPKFQRSLILHRGRTVQTPVGFNLLAPGKIWPMVKTPLLSLSGKTRVAAECFIGKTNSNEDESLGAFVRRRFGQEMLDRIVQPMVGGIYTSDPETLSLRATLPRFVELEQKHGSLIRGLRANAKKEASSSAASGARYSLFTTPEKGMSSLFEWIQQAIAGSVSIRLGVSATAVSQGTAGYEVQTSQGETINAAGVVLALPAYRAANVIGDLNPQLVTLLNQIDYASSAIVVSGHNLADVGHPLDAFGLVIPHIERRRILAVSFLSRKFPGRAPEGKAILRTFVGGAMQPEEIALKDEEIIENVLSELNSILKVRGEPNFVKLVRYRNAMPQYTVGHLSRVQSIRDCEQKLRGFSLAGNGFEGVGVPDCIHSGEKAAESVWQDVVSH